MFFSGLSRFLQLLIDGIGVTLGTLVSLLPSSPYQALAVPGELAAILGNINYFVPIYDFVAMLEVWSVAVSAYYLYSVWARWIKAIN